MLYDRLVLDLARGRQAQLDGDREAANEQLGHAQDIVAELLSSLDVDAWEGGPGLASLYRWLLRELDAPPTCTVTPSAPPAASRSSSRCATRGPRR